MASTGEPDVLSQNAFKSENNGVNGVIDEKPDDLNKIVDIVVQTWKLVKKDSLKHGTVFYKRLGTYRTSVYNNANKIKRPV